MSQLRILWYQAMATVEDEISQLKGICGILFFPGDFFSNTERAKFAPAFMKQLEKLVDCLPFRPTAYHVCFNDVRARFIFPVCIATVGRHGRLRLRAHVGAFFMFDVIRFVLYHIVL